MKKIALFLLAAWIAAVFIRGAILAQGTSLGDGGGSTTPIPGVSSTDSRLYGATTNYVLSGNGTGLASTYKALPASGGGGDVFTASNNTFGASGLVTNILGSAAYNNIVKLLTTNVVNGSANVFQIRDNNNSGGSIAPSDNTGGLDFKDASGNIYSQVTPQGPKWQLPNASSTPTAKLTTTGFILSGGTAGSENFSMTGPAPFISIKTATGTGSTGTTNLVGGTITVTNANIAIGDLIFATPRTVGGTSGILIAIATNGSWKCTSSIGVGDTSEFQFWVIHQN